MMVLLVGLVAFVASALTFVSGFGLGTLLMPVFAVFMPVERAVAATGVVHFLNSLFKFGLVGRHAHWPTVLRFGVPALLASLLGAWWLVRLADQPPLLTWGLGSRQMHVTSAKLLIGALLLVFVLVEWVPRWKQLTFPLVVHAARRRPERAGRRDIGDAGCLTIGVPGASRADARRVYRHRRGHRVPDRRLAAGGLLADVRRAQGLAGRRPA